MIGGFQPCSFIDFPGCLSAVVFLRGCNLKCPYCHNRGLLDSDGPSTMSEQELLAFLSSRRGRLDGVVLSGGEPTLLPGLRRLIDAVRARGFKVKLDTNGTRPEVLAELLDADLLDYVALDLKDRPEDYATWLGMRGPSEALLRSLELVLTSGVDHELRTTVVPSRHDEQRLASMARWARGCRRWFLQACRPDARQPAAGAGSHSGASVEELASWLRRNQGVNCLARSEKRRAPNRSAVARWGEAVGP